MDALYHRGPDASGVFQCDDYMAGVRRLSINDVAGGDQPLYNTDKSVVLLYNGEIYNSPEIRRNLQKAGYRFRTASDGEVICHLYEKYGENVFEHLDGMFACALWDVKERKLILARDLAGEKPLYYSLLDGGGIAFASEVKSLIKYPEIKRTLDHQALWDYPTFLWIPEPRTAFIAIASLPCGHVLVADYAGVRMRAYRNLCFEESATDVMSSDDLTSLVRETVTQSVHSRLLSDVPVGAFLSGGLDSTIVTTLAASKLTSLATFTIAFEDVDDPYHGKADESHQAAETARRLGTRHHTIKVTGDYFRELLPEFCAKGDLPFAVSSGLGVMAIARAARESGIKVLLTGDGADEAFGGYSWYPLLGAVDSIEPGPPLGSPVSYQNTGMSVQDRLRAIAGLSAPDRALAWHYYAAEAEKRHLFATEPFERMESSGRHFAGLSNATCRPIDYIRHDQRFYFPFEMLCKADRMTMGCSIEGRVPFAAPAVQALAGKLQYSDMIKGGTLKHILRQAFMDVLPKEIIDRPKHGFNVPVDHWLKNEWADLLEETFSRTSALSEHNLIAKDAYSFALMMRDDPGRLNGHTLFSYVMLNMWLSEIKHW